ncbi:MAG TPA: chemotaxis protein CheX [Candidatus Hydrogenedentes bacterium]|nr:chemotaxis protein CheX [Candidatus Hydrogenedentota bacterium]HOL76726.1 chemotaxis protein CheX [Candidatus Hydrogenedentota bacterium]
MVNTLRAEFVNPFLESTYAFFSSMLSCKARRGMPGLTDGSKRPNEVLALIGISGAVRGSLAITMPAETAIAIAGKLLGTQLSGFDETVSDCLGEAVNIIAGGAKAKLSELLNTTLDLTLPTVIRGGSYEMYSPSRVKWLEVPFSSDLGNFALRVMLDMPAK